MKKLSHLLRSKPSMLIAFTLMLAATFKLSAFFRETFIASRFGLSSVTDAYFSLQQFPLAMASFMFGPFFRAFTPAYADARRAEDNVRWLPGLLIYGTLFGLALTVLALICASPTIRLFTRSTNADGWPTLAVMSLCYWPIIQVGLFSGIVTSYGRNLFSLTIVGLPYLLMTLALGLMYLTGSLGTLSLPVSLTAGFAVGGILSATGILMREKPFRGASDVFRPWKHAGFSRFAGQLGTSSLENFGYSANQMLILFFMARVGTGAISANNCAGRIGLLGFSLLVQPLSQLMQARLCITTGEEQKKTFQNYLLLMAGGAITLALLVCQFRYRVAGMIYMHGKFSAAALNEVAALLPAWLTYFVILSLNVVLGQYLFRTSRGAIFTRNMLCGYGLANVIRFATMGAAAPWIIWCSALGDGSALLANLLSSAKIKRPSVSKTDRKAKSIAMSNQPIQGAARRILMVITGTQIGGAETQVVSLAQELQAKGWEVAVVSLLTGGALAGTLADSAIPVFSLGMKRGIPDPRALWRLARVVRTFKPGIVHSHMVHANLLARFTRLIEPMPVLICTAHSTREASVKGGPTWYKELLYRLTDRLGDWTTIICQAGWDHYVATGAVPAARLQVIPIGIDCQRFSPRPDQRVTGRAELAVASDEFAWLATARLVAVKDFPNLLHAFAPLKGGKWSLLIAGDGPLRQQLEALAKDLGLSSQVRFLGVRRDIPNLLHAVDAFVLSSQMEGLPVSALEAAASGLPCVVTDVGGTREAVLDGVNGYVVPARNAALLSHAVARMMSLSGADRQRFGQLSRAHCVDNFAMGSVVDRWEALYARLFAKAKSNAPSSQTALAGPATVPIKILYIITRSELGGAQIHVRDLIANLPAGCEAVLATGDRGYLYDEVSKLGIPVRMIHNLRRAMSPLRDLLALTEIIRLIRSERPALLHVHTSKAALLGRLAGVLTRTPVVFTAHTWSFAEGISFSQRALSIPLEWFAARVSGKIIAVSRANEQAAREKSIGKSANVITIWNGMPDTRFRATPGMNPTVTLIMVARFAPQKDQKTLLLALAQVTLPWKLWLAGDGPLRPEIEALARSLGIGEQIHFLGDRSDIGELLAAADIFVLSTNWEGFPLAILEAMRAGLPVIATDVGGCAEAVTQGVTGFLVPQGDASQLAAFIARLISSRPLLIAMGKAARARFEQDFQIERMVEKTLAVYASVVPEMAFTVSLSALGARLQEKNNRIPLGVLSTPDPVPVESELASVLRRDSQ